MGGDGEGFDAADADGERGDDGQGGAEQEVATAAPEGAPPEERSGREEDQRDPPCAGEHGDGQHDLQARGHGEEKAEKGVELLHASDATSWSALQVKRDSVSNWMGS